MKVEKEIIYVEKETPGLVMGIIASILAVLGIFTLGFVFIPLSMLFAVIGSFVAVKHKNSSGIGINVLAWVLIVVGFMTSPFLLGIISMLTSPNATYSTSYATHTSIQTQKQQRNNSTEKYSGVIPVFPSGEKTK